MTAIKIKGPVKSAKASSASAANKSTSAALSSGDDAAPASSSANGGRDTVSSVADDSSNGGVPSGNDEAVAAGEVDGSSAKTDGGEDDAPGKNDDNHDSNDAAGENGDAKPGANAKGEDDNEDGKEEEESSPNAGAGRTVNASDDEAQKEDGSDAQENLKEDENGEEEEEEMWELKKILTVAEITAKLPQFMCSTPSCPNVACSVWQSTLDTNCLDAWFSCLDCQENDYGGWPENKSEIPITFMTKQHRETICQHCTRNAVNAVFPDLPMSRNGDEEDKSDDEEADEKWDLIEVIALKDLKKKKPSRCQEEGCNLAACSVWTSNAEPDDEWYGCIDCMEEYYGGWPSSDEMPVKHLTEEHRALLAEKCSTKEEPPMPNLPTMPLLATAGEGGHATNITPLPSHEQAVADNQSNVVVGAFRSKGKKSDVTPSPMPKKGSSKQGAKKTAVPKIDPKTQAQLDKWRSEAKKMGLSGKDVIIDRNAAKKVVFDEMHDMFCPVNISQLYQKLKGLVPQPVLRGCLDRMVDKANNNPFADDSDEEDAKPSKKKSASAKSTDEYAGSLRVKEGRNSNTTLYYVDHTKLQNAGNGLLPEDKNELFSNLEKSKQELLVLGQKHKQICADTSQLLSEPKNEELENELQELTNKMEVVNNSLEEARVHASNAKHAKQLKGRIDSMAGEWRQRKRKCIEFIQNLEEATDGTVSLKKCCKGDGPIDLETDEAAIKGAKEYAAKAKKRPKVVSRGGLKQRNGASTATATASAGLLPDEKLVGVMLSASGMPSRVYLDEE